MGWFAAAILACGWLAWAWLVRVMERAPRGDALTGIAYVASRAYVRVVHRLRVEGLEHVPRRRDAGPLIVVCNHTAGVDPVLVQTVCPFHIRWMMGRDMRVKWLNDIWDWVEIIDVDRKGRDVTAARVALRALASGLIVGIFPEGRIERPRGRLLPFQPGLGLIVRSSGAPVLPVLIRGTPDAPTAWGSLTRRSRSVLRFGPLMRVQGDDARAIVREIESWFQDQLAAPKDTSPTTTTSAAVA